MNIPNPAQVASARTARLVREALTPAYSTESTAPAVPVREHITAVELEDDYGRSWSHMPDSEVTAYIDEMAGVGYGVSDIDHSGRCWCQ